MSAEDRVKTQLDACNASLDQLEAQLESLFARPFSETMASLDKLQQAKLQTALPYLVYDLVFMYLKTKGLDPKGHPVVPELARIKQYFDKISNAEKQLGPKETQRLAVDKDVAARFISRAIHQAQADSNAAITSTESGPSTFVPVKVTSKMKERAEYQKDLEAMDAEGSEDELQVIEDEVTDVNESTVSSSAKGKAKETSVPAKRKHPSDGPSTGASQKKAKGTPPQDKPLKEGKAAKKAKPKTRQTARGSPEKSTQ